MQFRSIIVNNILWTKDFCIDAISIQPFLEPWPCSFHNRSFEVIMDYYYPYHEIDAFVTVLVCVIICAILTLFAYLWYSKMSITVTDKRIYGSVAFGKRVDLPIDSISAVGISMFQGIAIGTSSGRIVFSMIKNRDEIHTVISNLLIQRQNQSQKTITTITQEIPLSNADEIKKYKDLLDSGVITQEEFDAKKKQLLGL